MAEPLLATYDDLLARMGDVDDRSRAEAALSDASALIRAEAGSEDWIDDDGALETVPAIIVTVCCKAAQRVLSNPDGITDNAIGSFRETYSNASTDVYLTKAERRLVRKAAGTTPIGSVELESPYQRYDTADLYVPVEGGGDDVLMGPWPSET